MISNGPKFFSESFLDGRVDRKYFDGHENLLPLVARLLGLEMVEAGNSSVALPGLTPRRFP